VTDNCICGYAFGYAEFALESNEEGFIIEFAGTVGEGTNATGELVGVEYTIQQYQLGILIDTITGNVTVGGFEQELIPYGNYTLVIKTKITMDDGAVGFFSIVLEVNIDEGYFVGSFDFDPLVAIIGCNTFYGKVLQMATEPPIRTVQPTWFDGELNVLSELPEYTTDIISGSNDFDIGISFGLDVSEWVDLSPEIDPLTLAGLAFKLISCDD